ncbi:hypothetical protein J6590_007925 [Homalodisca vitripennis]|nr:hypothetical protein J6590_007925 [Homalodisca vitripennis]
MFLWICKKLDFTCIASEKERGNIPLASLYGECRSGNMFLWICKKLDYTCIASEKERGNTLLSPQLRKRGNSLLSPLCMECVGLGDMFHWNCKILNYICIDSEKEREHSPLASLYGECRIGEYVPLDL